MNNKPILHLNLKKKWFDMIESGEKKEEYRDMSPYYFNYFKVNQCTASFLIKIKNILYPPSEVIICFSNGYRKDRKQMFVKCKALHIGQGKKEWGAEYNMRYFILLLGNKLKED